MKRILIYTLFACCVLILSAHKKEEGMFPLSHLKKVDLKSAGFKINEKDIYNPDGIALTDALVRLGGCTGSFVSAEGLIVTNHHCVFGAVAGLSTKENDYLENGFYAANRTQELRTSLTCKITKSYEDVSLKVLDGINLDMDPIKKKEQIKLNIDALLAIEKAKYPDLSIEISEMFVGYSYTLFRYQVLKDVRLVYVPPRTIGEFGGETDNWEWPKHTGDFSFVRAYIGKNGQAAEYSADNVPFVPKKHLTINPKGTKSNDLVFILGYPGTTYRQEPYQFIQYQQDYVLPFVSNWYGWKINLMEELGATDRNRYLKMAGNIKQLANTKKNFEGKLYGLSTTGLLDIKKEEQNSLKANMASKQVNTSLFNTIDSLYQIKLNNASIDLWFNLFNREANSMIQAIKIAKVKTLKKAPDAKDSAFWKTWRKAIITNGSGNPDDIELQQKILAELIKRTQALPKQKGIKYLYKIKDPLAWVKKAYEASIITKPQFNQMVQEQAVAIYNAKDPLMTLAYELAPLLKQIEDRSNSINAQISNCMPALLEAKIKYTQKAFIPDANSTLRFTYGYISAYKTGLNKHPFPYTNRQEIFEKNATDNTDYRLSAPVKSLLLTQNIDPILLDPETGELLICMLYNMDTTGGNSGSPVMDAEGNLVGVNFDRAYTATLNDYSWNPDYSRSIAVDIRYVLFTMKYLNHADNLLSEMGVSIK